MVDSTEYRVRRCLDKADAAEGRFALHRQIDSGRISLLSQALSETVSNSLTSDKVFLARSPPTDLCSCSVREGTRGNDDVSSGF
jgi:hypothetical protein